MNSKEVIQQVKNILIENQFSERKNILIMEKKDYNLIFSFQKSLYDKNLIFINFLLILKEKNQVIENSKNYDMQIRFETFISSSSNSSESQEIIKNFEDEYRKKITPILELGIKIFLIKNVEYQKIISLSLKKYLNNENY